MAPSLEGRVLGAYRIERLLGQGGMGAVYVGRHARTGRTYAVKVLLASPEGHASKDALARFRREADALASIGHAHIVAIHDYDETPDGLWFLVMDLLEGEDLAHRLQRTGPMPWQDAIALLDPIASAIEAAHRAGLVHRDLKPSNVFLARPPGAATDIPKLLDFGLARALEHGEGDKVTATGMVMGTPSYMSPEQAQGAPLDGRSDLWALAVMLFEMIAGRAPFEGSTLTATLVAVMTAPRPRLNDRGFHVPEALEAVLDRALVKEPAGRYPDVASFRAALADVMRGAPVTGPTVVRASPAAFAATEAIVTPSAQPAATPAGSIAPTVPAPIATRPGTALPAPEGTTGSSLAPWLAAGAMAIGIIASAGLGVGYLLLGPRIVAPAPSPVIAAPSPVIAAPIAIAHAPPDAGAPDAPATLARLETEASTPSDAPSDRGAGDHAIRPPRLARDRRDEPRGEAPPIDPSPGEPAAPVPADGPEASGPPSGGPPPALVRATDLMGVGDFQGCLRELEHAGTSAPILGARMNCAMRTGRRSDLVTACDLLHRHHPSHTYTRTCDSVLGVTP